MLIEAPTSYAIVIAHLLLSSYRLAGIQTWFLRFISETGSDGREVIGGILLYYFRPIQRYMDRRDRTSSTEARSTTLFFCLSVCYADFSNFAKGYRPQFSPDQAAITHQQSPRSNLKSCWKLGGWDSPKGLFCPLKTAQLTKNGAVKQAKLCGTYSPLEVHR